MGQAAIQDPAALSPSDNPVLHSPAASSPGEAPPHVARPFRAVRRAVELLVLLAIGLNTIRLFVAEAYIVPSGSMAPSLVGIHRELLCPRCRTVFPLGVDLQEWEPGKPVCPNCGHGDFEGADATLHDGDRVLVQKHLFALRPPRRWELAVFASRESPGELFVKRVVGLPGDTIEIRGGDIYRDGQILRKSLANQRALRVLVYDHDHRPPDYAFAPRWIFRSDASEGPARLSPWRADGDGFEAQGDPADQRSADEIDWLIYRHWQPDRQAPGPVRDFLDYDGVGISGDYRVDDLMLAFEVAVPPEPGGICLALGRGSDRLQVRLDAAPGSEPEVRQNGRPVAIRPRNGRLTPSLSPSCPRYSKVEASYFDRRLLVAIDGRLAFDPLDLPDDDSRPPGPPAELGIGLAGSSARLRHLQVYRDVYYTPQLAGSFRPAFAVGSTLRLGADEFFVLGDNSVISHDSRFWSQGPVVRRSEFVGKPFLVHWPGRMTPLFLFGRGPYWVPDFLEIRYIQ